MHNKKLQHDKHTWTSNNDMKIKMIQMKWNDKTEGKTHIYMIIIVIISSCSGKMLPWVVTSNRNGIGSTVKELNREKSSSNWSFVHISALCFPLMYLKRHYYDDMTNPQDYITLKVQYFTLFIISKHLTK